jgi:D-alanyl-D-alanine dipeptidase
MIDNTVPKTTKYYLVKMYNSNMSNTLVAVTSFSRNIRELPVVKRIAINYPLLCLEEVAMKLAMVVDALPPGLFLQIDSAYRTRTTQEVLWNNKKEVMGNLVFNPSDGVPPHCTGGAVDVSILDVKGKEINLSAPFKKFYEEPQLESDKITKEAQLLRLKLHKLMLAQGFAPNPKEYWHFSYGDKMWADYCGCSQFYGELSLDDYFYYPALKVLYYKIVRYVWKLLNKVFKIEVNY